jgi:hypothetical protein
MAHAASQGAQRARNGKCVVMQSSLKNVSGHAATHGGMRAAFRSGQVGEVFGRSFRQGQVDARDSAVVGMESHCSRGFIRCARAWRRGRECRHAAAGAGAALAAIVMMRRRMIDIVGRMWLRHPHCGAVFWRHCHVCINRCLRRHVQAHRRRAARQHAGRGKSLERDGGKHEPDEERFQQFVHWEILALLRLFAFDAATAAQ